MTNASIAVNESLESLVAEVADEFLRRQREGERPDVEEYAARYPRAAELLRKVLAALAVVGLSQGGLVAQASEGPEPATGMLGDFRLLREVGRGGMGIVYEAEQVSLGRRVALKVLPFAATLDPRQLQRFHNEARAAAGLHHTNIVPVHAVGCERGVHYYAMQFIEGRTLAEFVAGQRREAVAGVLTTDEGAAAEATTRPAKAEATSTAPRDRAYYRRVAEWGIQAAEALDCAHTLGVLHRDVKPANLIVDAAGRLWVTDFGLAQVQSDPRLTMTGDLVGTLRYMSPEQALAKRVVVDHRTDVYSLGATLYELLTLQPAYGGNDRQELLRQIAFEEPRPPRRVNKAVPAELETIVLKAMEKNPAERYATAQELADDLRRFLEDRPIRARRPSWAQAARKWARRHRTAVRAAAALLLTVLMLGGAALWREQRHRDAAERAARVSLERADLLQGQERWQDALAALTAAEQDLEGRGLGALRQQVKERRRDVEMLTRLEKARLQGAAGDIKARTWFDDEGTDRLYTEAFGWYDLDVLELSPQEAARRVQASAICSRLTAALDSWAMVRDKLGQGGGTPLRAVADLADDVPWTRRLRRAVGRGDRAALEELAKGEDTWRQPPASLMLLYTALQNAGSGAANQRLLRRAQKEHPADFWINFYLAIAQPLQKAADVAEAVRFFQAALALLPDSPVVYTGLALALREQGKLPEAVEACRKAIELQPDYNPALNNLGALLVDLGQLAEAEAAFRKAIAVKGDDATAYYNRGLVSQKRGKLADAVAAYRESIRLRPRFAHTHNHLGLVLADLGKWAEAETAYRQAIKHDADTAAFHHNLAIALFFLGKPVEAEEADRQAIKLKPDYAEAHGNRGVALNLLGRHKEAEAACREALRIKPGYLVAHGTLGGALFGQGHFQEAEAICRKALRLKPDHAETHYNLGNALWKQGKLAEAENAYREAIKLKPDYAAAHANLGSVLHDKKDVEGAIRYWRLAIDHDPKLAEAHANLGKALKDKGNVEGAVREYRRAIELGLKSADAHNSLGLALAELGKVNEAIREFRLVIAFDPRNARYHYNLGNILQSQGKVEEAIACFRRAVALDPKFALAHYNLGNALQGKGMVEEAISCFRQAIKIDPKNAHANGRLGQVLLQKGCFAEARDASARALQLLPRGHPLWTFASRQLEECRRLASLEEKLSPVLRGDADPASPAEGLEAASLCQHKQWHATAARFASAAFLARAKLADDRQQQHRYNAACSAALAAAGQAQDARFLPDKVALMLRRQALRLLMADLALWRRQLEQGEVGPSRLARILGHWRKDADLASVRDPESLARLDADERQHWHNFWQEVDVLVTRTPAIK